MTQQLDGKTLGIIRAGMAGGIGLFLVMALVLPRDGGADSGGSQLLTYLTYAVSAAAVAMALVQRGRTETAASPAEAIRACIIAWATGEGSAVLGLVAFMQGAGWPAPAAGIIAFLAVLTLVPIPERTPA